jgi:hypothetical protein
MIWRAIPKWRQIFSSTKLPYRLWGHPSSYSIVRGFYSGSKSDWGLKLITAPCSVEAKNGHSEYSPTYLEVLGTGNFTFLLSPYYFNGIHTVMSGSIE